MQAQAQAHLLLPQRHELDTLRALLLNLNILPVEHTASVDTVAQLVKKLGEEPLSFAVVGRSVTDALGVHLLGLQARFAPGLRSRVFLIQDERAQLLPGMRSWAQGLGFADMLPEVEARALIGDGNHGAAQRMSTIAQRPFDPRQAQRYFGAMGVLPAIGTPRSVIRRKTGLDAEDLVHLWASSVRTTERSYRLKRYPACFLGTEAAQWLCQRFTLSASDALRVGQALLALGLINHVSHEHDFEASDYFYRTALSSVADRISFDAAITTMVSKAGLAIADRSYRARSYPQCFVGSEAVDWLCSYYRMGRHEAEIFFNRLHALGLIEHVTQDHRVRDGNFFYRLHLS